MNEKALRILEFHKIIDMLTEKASSAPGKELCKKLTPYSDLDTIETAQTQTADAFTRLIKGGRIHFSGNKDISFSIKSLEIGSTLSVSELLKIAASLSCASQAKAFARKENDEEIIDSLQPLFEVLAPLTPLQNEITRCIISEEEIAALVKTSKDYYLFDVVKVEDDQNTTGHFLYLFGLDADEETSYWFQIEFDKSILEWERYMNRVQTNG